MKRIVMLATLLAFVLGMAATASAADLVASGSFRFAAMWTDNMDFLNSDVAGADDTQSEDDATFEERVRTTFAFVANENLQGVLALEIGTTQFGDAGSPMSADARGIVEIKSAYINFVWPNTNVGVFMGIMPIALPGGPGGSPILDEDVAGVVVSSPITDNVSVAAGWTRLSDDTASLTGNDDNQTTDVFLDAAFVIVPMQFDGFSVTPYMAAAYSGSDFVEDYNGANGIAADFPGLISQNATVDDGAALFITYAGLTFDVSLLDPFNLSGAFHYGSMQMSDSDNDRAGWLGEIQLTYTGWDMVTPSLYFGYSSGEDGNASGGDTDYSEGDASSERLPQVADSYAVGTFWFGNDWYDGELVDGEGVDQMGFWTVGLFLNDISFFEGLTHQINILYVEGTNDSTAGSRYGAGVYGSMLTEDDSLWEFDLNTTYQIYDELTAVVRLGYIDMDYDEDNWAEINADEDSSEDAAKLMIGFDYSF